METIQPAIQHPEQTDEPAALEFEFLGSGREYFNIWIVNIFLSIITLGIFSAWAKVRREQYFYGNLRLGQHHFAYLADPVQILKGRIIAFGLLAIYWAGWNFVPITAIGLLIIGVLALPAILVAASRFKMRNSSYRNIRFRFTASFTEAYRTFIKPLAIILGLSAIGYLLLYQIDPETLTAMANNGQTEELPDDFRVIPEDLLPTVFYLALFPFLPYLDYLRVKLLMNHTRWGDQQARINAGAGGFYRVFVVGFLLSGAIATLAMVVVFAVGALIGMTLGEIAEPLLPAGVVIALLLVYGSTIYSAGYWRAERTNLIYGNTRVGDASIGSVLTFHQVGKLYVTNTLAILFSAGLLIPWAHVRMAQYIASVTSVAGADLDKVVMDSDAQQGALGEGMVDAFDLDIGL